MIPLIQILEHLRKQRGYIRTMLARELATSVKDFSYKNPEAAIIAFVQNDEIPNYLIQPWCEYLDLGIKDYEPLYQYNERERVFRMIEVVTDFKLSKPIASMIADIIHFHQDIPFLELRRVLLPTLLNKIYEQPFLISNALMDAEKELDERA